MSKFQQLIILSVLASISVVEAGNRKRNNDKGCRCSDTNNIDGLRGTFVVDTSGANPVILPSMVPFNPSSATPGNGEPGQGTIQNTNLEGCDWHVSPTTVCVYDVSDGYVNPYTNSPLTTTGDQRIFEYDISTQVTFKSPTCKLVSPIAIADSSTTLPFKTCPIVPGNMARLPVSGIGQGPAFVSLLFYFSGVSNVQNNSFIVDISVIVAATAVDGFFPTSLAAANFFVTGFLTGAGTQGGLNLTPFKNHFHALIEKKCRA